MSTDDNGNNKKPGTKGRKAPADSSKRKPAAKSKTDADKSKQAARKAAPKAEKSKTPESRPSNIVPFPTGAAAGRRGGPKAPLKPGNQRAADVDYVRNLHVPGEFAVTDALEFASITALEAAGLLGQIAEGVLSYSTDSGILSAKEADDAADLILQLLDTVLIKLRGLAMIVPPRPILEQSIPDLESIAGYESLGTGARNNSERLQGLLYDVFDSCYGSEAEKDRMALFREPEFLDELDEICSDVQELGTTLDEMTERWYDQLDTP